MKIGIFGGSFNPPHNMHKNIALQLIEQNYLDKIIYVPVGDLYSKSNLVSAIDRYRMIQRMIEPYPNLEVSDYEFNKLTYTYQTLQHFQDKYPNDEIYFICGTDNFKELHTWKNYTYLLNNFNFIVITRNNDNIEKILKQYQDKHYHITILKLIYNTISSTEIRNILKKDRYSKELIKKLEPTTLEYIYQKNLYL